MNDTTYIPQYHELEGLQVRLLRPDGEPFRILSCGQNHMQVEDEEGYQRDLTDGKHSTNERTGLIIGLWTKDVGRTWFTSGDWTGKEVPKTTHTDPPQPGTGGRLLVVPEGGVGPQRLHPKMPKGTPKPAPVNREQMLQQMSTEDMIAALRAQMSK